MKAKPKVVPILMPPEMAKALKTHAVGAERSASSIVREMLAEHLKKAQDKLKDN